jgi:hypothetical protein
VERSPSSTTWSCLTLTQQALLERRNQLVQLIAKFWDIECDGESLYLPGLTEERLVSSAGGRQVSRTGVV